jgi:phosphatidylserine/phosphatidylglycerophosphate/cardiolipin synthase-like enzyme
MRTISDKVNGVRAKAYAGTTGTLVAMNIDERKRSGLLGFAIERRKQGAREYEWLFSSLQFPDVPHTDRENNRSPSNVAPLQKFRWSDYGAEPDKDYSFIVHPVYGRPGSLRVEDGPEFTVRSASIESGEQSAIFNRAAAASQAFSRRFPEVDELLKTNKTLPIEDFPLAARKWLTRGLLEQIEAFLALAEDDGWALDVAIYEYELKAIVEAVNAARRRGATVRIVYHAKEGDKQTAENEHSLQRFPAAYKRARVTDKIFHDKFIVLSRMERGERRPRAVLCGSTNFTENGLYRQGNVVHVVREGGVAGQYLAIFEQLFEHPEDVGAVKDWITANNPIDRAVSTFAGFSPRRGGGDLQEFVEIINDARRDVLFCTVFNLHDPIEDALLGAANDPILRYGLQNSRSRITGFHADRTANFTVPAMLTRGLEGWLKESTRGQRGNILIHTKIVVVDFTSDSPTIISGSHNLSGAASHSNDENYLIIRGNADIADCYGVEVMRFYDHYRFRSYMRDSGGRTARPLAVTDEWANGYFLEGKLKCADRLRFAGR